MKISAVILSGGKASRMGGIAKGNLNIHGKSIIWHLIDMIHTTGLSKIIISANDPKPYAQYQLPIIPDKRKDFGPSAGIEAALEYYQNKADAVLILPCDLPNLTAEILKKLIHQYTDASFPRRQESSHSKQKKHIIYAATSHPHPLCAMIPITYLKKLSKLLDEGHQKVLTVFKRSNAKEIYFENERAFLNFNSLKQNKTKFWCICGAYKGVGKTTLAQKLLQMLPNSTYIKCSHAIFNPNKQPNFCKTLEELKQWIEKSSKTHDHLIIESNTFAKTDQTDIVLFVDGDDKNKRRKDYEELKKIADIIVTGEK